MAAPEPATGAAAIGPPPDHAAGANFNSLPGEILERVAAALPDNDVADGLRLANRAAARALAAPRFRWLHLSMPVSTTTFRLHWGDATRPGAARSLPLAKRHELLRLVAASGVLANLQAALVAADCRPPGDLFKDGVSSSAEVCSWVAANIPQRGPGVLYAAAASGCLPVLQAAAQEAVAGRRRALCAEQIAVAAARHGHQHVVEWALEAAHDNTELKRAKRQQQEEEAGAPGKPKPKPKDEDEAGGGTGVEFYMYTYHMHTVTGTAMRYGHLRLAAWLLEVYGRRLLQRNQRWRERYREGEEVEEPPPAEEEETPTSNGSAAAGADGAERAVPPPPRLAHVAQLKKAEEGLGPMLMVSASAGAPMAWVRALHAAFFPRDNGEGCCNAYTSSWIKISIETAAGSEHPDWQEKVDWLMTLDGGPNFPPAAFDCVCTAAAGVSGPPGAGAERVRWLLRRCACIRLSLRPHAAHAAARIGDLPSFAALLEMQREQGPDRPGDSRQHWGRSRQLDGDAAERLQLLASLGFTPGLRLVVEQMGLAAAAAVTVAEGGGGRGDVEMVPRPRPWAWVPAAAKAAVEGGHLDTLAYLAELVQLDPPPQPPPPAVAAVAAGAAEAAAATAAAPGTSDNGGTTVPRSNAGGSQPEAAAATGAAASDGSNAGGATATHVPSAAGQGRLADLLSPRLMAAAACAGATHVMRWLHARGCGMDARSWLAAARGGCCEAMELLAAWSCPRPRCSGQCHEVVSQAVTEGDLMGLRCLQRLGWDVAAGLKPLPPHARRPPAGSRDADPAADPNEHYPALRLWLKAQRRGGLRGLIVGLGGGGGGSGGSDGGAEVEAAGQEAAGKTNGRGGFWRRLKRLLTRRK